MRDMVNVPSPNRSQQYQAPSMRLGRSQFNLSHRHKTTFDAGYLIPYFIREVVPGDTFTCRMESFIRIFSPLEAPIMDDIEASIDFFYIPTRLLWDNWENHLGAHTSAGAQDVDYTVPILGTGTTFDHTMSGLGLAYLGAYMGIPHGLSTTTEDINALPFRAYNLTYNQWYRDQSVLDEVSEVTGDGPDTTSWYFIRKSAKKHDYFTSALPYLQKGTAQVVTLADAPIYTDANSGSTIGLYSTSAVANKQLDANLAQVDVSATTATTGLLYADLSAGFTVNALREAAAVQRMLERDARGGTRLPEKIRSHFGVDVPDYRVQRPEYLGGGRGYINVSPVANMSATATENQGELRGIGTGSLSCSWAKSFVEHGYVLGLLRARGEITYSQGLDRMWSRSTRYDWLWPELAQLGEQEILNKELYIVGDATDDNVFGYQERYADWRFAKSLVTGKFHPEATGSLDIWHLSEEFGTQPGLNQTFIEDQTPMARVTTVASEPDFLIDGFFDLRVARALPVRPTPTLMPARF